MKGKKPIMLVSILLAALGLAVGCGNTGDYNTDEMVANGMVKVTFDLDGGNYRNCEGVVNYYYDFKPGESKRIKNPAANEKKSTINGRFVDATVKKEGFYLDGWYTSREEVTVTNEDGKEEIEYLYDEADKWDFEKNTVSSGGTILYARWMPVIKYTYNICCIENGQPVKNEDGSYYSFYSYNVKKGERFSDYGNKKNTRPNYTAVQGTDNSGNKTGWFFAYDEATQTFTPWDDEFAHPGGDESTAINVFVHYEPGKFEEVGTKEELLDYCRRKPWSGAKITPMGIRLTADIDLQGEEIEGFPDFKGTFDGRSHTISNFKLKYDNSKKGFKEDNDFTGFGNSQLHISLFGGLGSAVSAIQTTVKDVTFENMTIEVDINYVDGNSMVTVSPFCSKAKNATVSNVTVTGEVKEIYFHPIFAGDGTNPGKKETNYILARDKTTGNWLPLPKIPGDGNNRNSVFDDVDLSGVKYTAL